MPDKQNTAAMAHDVPMGDIELDPKAFEGIDVERSLQTARRPKYVKEPTLIGRAAEGGKYEVCSGAAWLLKWGRPDTANVLLADLGAAGVQGRGLRVRRGADPSMARLPHARRDLRRNQGRRRPMGNGAGSVGPDSGLGARLVDEEGLDGVEGGSRAAGRPRRPVR